VVFLDKGEKRIVEEEVPPVWLEGESDGSKRVPDEQENSKALITQGRVEKASLLPREKSTRIQAQPLLDYLKLHNLNLRGSQQSKQTEAPEEEENRCVMMDYALVGAEEDPTTVKEAKDREDWPEWKKAMDSEMLQLGKRGTFKLVELPPDRSAIASKWVYRLKRDHVGEIIKHKVRLVAKGCSQIPGLDFLETFAPVMRLETFRLLIVIRTELGLIVHMVDVVGTYLNGKLEEVIFMMQPPKYDDSSRCVWQLLQPLYGLKQAG
jgi:Reverse transcriptase (RNA-dependent DNA polymerase)